MTSLGEHLNFCSSYSKLNKNGMPGFNVKGVFAANSADPSKYDLKQELMKKLNFLLNDTEKNITSCKDKLTLLNNQKLSIIDQKSQIYSRIDSDTTTLNNEKAIYEGEIAKCKSIENTINSINNNMNDLNNRINKAREKRKNLEKWSWVPGYNVYLLIDYEVDSDVQKQDSLRNELSRINNSRDQLNFEVEKLKISMKATNQSISNLSAEINELNNKLLVTIESIDKVNRDIIQWQELRLYYGNMRAKLENDIDVVSINDSLLNLQKTLKNIA